ncbi:CDP-alcohol phosphatidyltransferase family protein [Elusimicrobiota bacterium]
MRILPNHLTVSRACLAPVFVLAVVQDEPAFIAAAFLVALFSSITDMLDGYLARRQNRVTTFGISFDPIADKIFAISAFFAISLVVDMFLASLAIILILARELVVTGLRIIVLTVHGKLLMSEKYSKFKSALQVIFVILVTFGIWLDKMNIGSIGLKCWPSAFLWIVTLVSVVTGISYMLQHSKSLSVAWNSKKNNQ